MLLNTIFVSVYFYHSGLRWYWLSTESPNYVQRETESGDRAAECHVCCNSIYFTVIQYFYLFIFITVDYGGVGSRLKAPTTYRERLKVEIEQLNAMFAVENLDVHVPILCVRTSLDGHVSDWSNKVSVL